MGNKKDLHHKKKMSSYNETFTDCQESKTIWKQTNKQTTKTNKLTNNTYK